MSEKKLVVSVCELTVVVERRGGEWTWGRVALARHMPQHHARCTYGADIFRKQRAS